MKRAKRQFRQGDVLVEWIDQIPVRSHVDERLLVRGEGRNHGHYIIGEVDIYAAQDSELDEQGGNVTHYLNVKQDATLEHLLVDAKVWTKEHDKIYIPPGTYRVVRQREYDPYADTIRILQD